MKGLFDKLNQANSAMNTANNTAWNVRRTKQNVDQIGESSKRSKEQKAAAAALEWKCECGKKNTSKFCDSCGKGKPVCSNCGARATGSKFCPECGTPM
jgi:membrane protease subunit (stomatin/prohibitin family)